MGILPFFDPSPEYQDERLSKKVIRFAYCLIVAFTVTWVLGLIYTGDPAWMRDDIVNFFKRIVSR